MPDSSLNLNWITPELAVGGRLPDAAAHVLARELGIRRVVDVRLEDCDDEAVLRDAGITFLHLPTVDRCAIDQAKLRDGVRWVSAALDAGERVLIHCEHGIGRSALLALCVLVSRGAAPLDALERAKAARSVVSPSPEQLEAFITFCRQLHDGRLVPWDVPHFDALAWIAYRHLREDART